MSEVAGVLATTAGVTATVMLGMWLLSLALRDASIVDIYWGPGFAVIAWTAHAAAGRISERGLLAAVLVTIWAIRLGTHLLGRNWGQGEDPRYRAMRRRHGARFPWVSLGTVYGLQAGLMWLVSLPVQIAQVSTGGVGGLELLGAAVFAVGLGFEAVGDAQLTRFKADPENRGKVMDRGLWSISRHPNYFGDALAWWGLFLLCAGAPGALWTLPAPALMTFLLLRVSGVPMLERGLEKSRPGYAAYAARTPAFVPWFPRRQSS